MVKQDLRTILTERASGATLESSSQPRMEVAMDYWNRGHSLHGPGPVRLFPPFGRTMKILASVLGGLYVAELLWVHWIWPALQPEGGGLMALQPTAALEGLHLGLVPVRVLHGEVWTMLTYALLHDPTNPGHLLLNLLVLWLFGADMERRVGTRRFWWALGWSTLGGALGVMLLASVLPMEQGRLVIGCSAGVYGIMTMFALTYRDRVLWPVPIKGIHLIPVMLGFAILGLLMRSTDSFGAHMGGMATGALIATGTWHPVRAYRAVEAWLGRRGKAKKVGRREQRQFVVLLGDQHPSRRRGDGRDLPN